jgi:hypothetical protein
MAVTSTSSSTMDLRRVVHVAGLRNGGANWRVPERPVAANASIAPTNCD